MTPRVASLPIFIRTPIKTTSTRLGVSARVWGQAGASLGRLSSGDRARSSPLAPTASRPPPPQPRLELPRPSFRPRAGSGSRRKGAGDARAAALPLFCWNRGPPAGPGIPARDPGPAQSRPLLARCFWRPGGRSSSLGRRREAQACLFLCSASRDSCTQGRRPPSRASQRRGRAPGGSLTARGFSASRGFSSFRRFSSFRGLSSFRDFSFRGLSFRGLSLGPPWARGARFSPAASPGSPSSFRAAAGGTSGLSSAFTWGAGGTDGGAQATGFGCTRDSGGGGVNIDLPRSPGPFALNEGPAPPPSVMEGSAYQVRCWLFGG